MFLIPPNRIRGWALFSRLSGFASWQHLIRRWTMELSLRTFCETPVSEACGCDDDCCDCCDDDCCDCCDDDLLLNALSRNYKAQMVKGGLGTGDRPMVQGRQSPRIARNELITSRYWSTAFLSPANRNFPDSMLWRAQVSEKPVLSDSRHYHLNGSSD